MTALDGDPGPDPGEVVVAVAQLRLQVGEVAANRAAAATAVADAAARGARLVVLPELADTGYVFDSAEEAAALADPTGTLDARCALAAAHDVTLVGGFCEVDDAGALRNSAAVVDRRGVVATYRKAHLWDREQDVFVAGDIPPPVVDTEVGRVSVLICFDLEWPAWVGLAARAGADVLAVPTAWPAFPVPAGERPVEVVVAQAAAAVNRMWVAVACRVGPERGVTWTGGSCIVDPDGYPAGPPLGDAPGLAVAAVRPALARDKRVGPRNLRLADARPLPA